MTRPRNLNDLAQMTETQNLRDCAIIATIKIFALAYFSLFVLQFLLFHFPSSPGMIINSLSVIFFSGGVLLACLSSLIYRTLSAFQGEDAAEWQKLEFAGTLILIYAATIPSVVLQFRTQPSIQLGYLFAFTLVAVGNLVDFLVLDSNASVVRARFPYHCVSLGLLALVPTIHTLSETFHQPSPLALEFLWLAGINTFGAAFYLLRPLERMEVFTWRPSLYVMHFILAYSTIAYSRSVSHATLRFAPQSLGSNYEI